MNLRSHIVRPATAQDLNAIVELERATQHAPHWPYAAYEQIVRAADSGSASGDGRARCLLVAVPKHEHSDPGQGEPVPGFAAGALVMQAGRAIGLPAELESIAVSGASRRQGIARSLCLRTIEWASAHGAESLQLEVRAGNTIALRFYQALGFQETGRRRAYYSNPEEDALLLSWRLG